MARFPVCPHNARLVGMKNAWRANWPHLLVLAALVALGACGTDGKSTPDVTDAAVLDHLPELEAGPVDASPVDQLDTRVEETLPELPDLAPEVEAVETVEETTPDVPPEIKPPCETGDDCEAGDYCTVDKCVGGECLHQEKNCNDGNKCTEDWCDPESGLCQHEPSDCEDGNPCTWDSCMPGTGCEHEEIPDCCPGTLKTEEGFEEGLSWTVVTEFQPEGNGATWQTSEGKAHGGDFSLYMGSMETLNYDFGGRVRVFAETLPLELSADVASELRFWTWMNLEASANYDTFTLFVVDEDGMTPVFGKEKGWLMKKWKAIQIDLKAYRGKTVKFRFVFDSIDGKDNDYEGIYIDDFQVWEMCPDQGCITKVECNDGLVCTEDKCVGGTCQYTFVESCCMNLGDCLDTDPCTIDACKENLCEPLVLSPPYCCYAPEDCEDDNVCTQDICDESGICLHPPSMAPGCCEVNADCDDGNPCTDDICNPDDSSCYFPFNSVGCDDGNKCTKNDHCIEGSCGGDPVVCSDGNNCTYDQCNPDTGCYYPNIPQGEACDDLNACTQNDVCLLGECGGEWVEGCCLKD